MATTIDTELQAAQAAEATASAKLATLREKAARLAAEAEARKVARKHVWAEGVVASYDADHAALEDEYKEATDRVYVEAVRDATAGVTAYINLLAVATRRRFLVQRLRHALSTMGKETFRGVAIPQVPYHSQPGTYAEMVERAIQRENGRLAADAEEAFSDEITAAEAGE